MSSYSDYADAASRILENKGQALAGAKARSGELIGSTIANLGQVIPQQVQQAIQQNAQRRKTAQIQQIIQQNGGDLDQALPQIMGVDATIGQKLASEHAAVQKSIADVQKIRQDAVKAQLDYSDRLLGQVNDEGSYAHWALVDKALGGQPLDHYDPDWVKQKKQSLLSMKDQMDLEKPIVVGGNLLTQQGKVLYEGEPKRPPQPTEASLAADLSSDDPAVVARAEKALAALKPGERARVPPNVGSFEDYVTRTYGPNPTPEQVIKARRDYGTADDRLAGQQAADITNLTPAGIDMAALNYRKTGQLPPLGMGDRTTRQKILNRAAELTPTDIQRIEAGGTDVAGNRAAYRADTGSLATLQKQRDAIGAFENTAKKNIDNFLAVAKKVPDTGIPLLNTPVRWIAGAGGSADMAKYNAARQVAVSEIAKIVQNPNLSGQLSDNARREIEVFNPTNATLGQTIAVMNLLKQDMENRKTSLDEQLKATRGRIGGGAPETAPPASATPGLSYQDYLNSKKK